MFQISEAAHKSRKSVIRGLAASVLLKSNGENNPIVLIKQSEQDSGKAS